MRHASSGARRLREPSVRVREAAAEQLEERRSDWAYSKPVVVLDMAWNLAFVAVTVAVLTMSRAESPSVPLRLWISGYALQCMLHMACVVAEYHRRRRNLIGPTMVDGGGDSNTGSGSNLISSWSSVSGSDRDDYVLDPSQDDDSTSVSKHLESANTMFSFIWWIIGFYWVSIADDNLTHDSPQLYWLCITFLAFDVFFVVICVAVACLIGIAVCCFLPCIIAILYAVADQEGATKEEIDQLPKYKYIKISGLDRFNGEIKDSHGGIMTKCDTDMAVEHVLSLEDAECCICLSAYDDGIELRQLPCRHHFHCSCVDKWLRMNATCPLCKFDVLKNGCQTGAEEV